MAKAKSFRDVVAWQKAHQYVISVYSMTANFPKTETFGLISQFRRAATSVAANIAEGFKKAGYKDKLRFLNISQASLEECRYYEILTNDLRYFDKRLIENQSEEISKILNGYMNGISNKLN